MQGKNHLLHDSHPDQESRKGPLTGKEYTDSTKINRPEHNIRMYWTNFWQPSVNVEQNTFEKTLIKVGSAHIYVYFGTFCVQIVQFFEAQWFFEKKKQIFFLSL